ncbi:MAG: RHS repeat-associated core domain-containing protein [Candidatus Thiodiazotropha endolucinida]
MTWEAERKPFGERTVTTVQIEMPLGFPGQYFDEESGNYYNYFRDYDPSTGRYLQSDPIGLEGGLNTYAYVRGNPLRYIDIYGLEPWDWDGQGDTSMCRYYDEQAQRYPDCNYYKKAADICRGNNFFVNRAVNTGLSVAWASGGLVDSQSTVLNNVRQVLIWEDVARRQEGNTDADSCVCGNDIDRYHNFAFEFSGMPPWSYGGNNWPQGTWPNPVPNDPRNR